EITSWGNSEAEAKDALKDIKVKIEQNGQTIKVYVDQAVVVDMIHVGPSSGKVNFTVTVPADTTVSLNSVNGDLSVSGINGNADLQTDFGDLSLADLTGEVTAKSGNGQILAQKITSKGPVTLSSEFGGTKSIENIQGSNITISSTN